MEKISFDYYKTPVGELILASYKNELCMADWRYRKMRNTIDKRIKEQISGEFFQEETDIIKETKKQFDDYFTGKLKTFTIPLLLAGTDFQKLVWTELIRVPYGKTETYLGLSMKLEKKKAIRAVAAANGANAISIIIPCHRIIGANGDLVGYAGGLPAKKKLLALEEETMQKQLHLFDV